MNVCRVEAAGLALPPDPTLPFALPQVRSPTSVRCAGRPSARAPTSSPTAASTQASSPSVVSCAPRASSARWTYVVTVRASTTSSETTGQPAPVCLIYLKATLTTLTLVLPEAALSRRLSRRLLLRFVELLADIKQAPLLLGLP